MKIFSLFGNMTRVIFAGDHNAAFKLLGEAHKVLHQMREQVSFQKLNIYQMHRKVGNAIISAMTVNGQEVVQIATIPPLPLLVKKRWEGRSVNTLMYYTGHVYTGSEIINQFVRRMDPLNGNTIWEYPITPDGYTPHGVGCNEDSVFVTGHGNYSPYPPMAVHAFSEAGKHLWTKEIYREDDPYSSYYIKANNKRVVVMAQSPVGTGSKMICLDAKTGDQVWEYTRPGIFWPYGVNIDEDHAYLAFSSSNSDWGVACLKEDTGGVKWVSVTKPGEYNQARILYPSTDGEKLVVIGFAYHIPPGGTYSSPFWRTEIRNIENGELVKETQPFEQYATNFGVPYCCVDDKNVYLSLIHYNAESSNAPYLLKRSMESMVREWEVTSVGQKFGVAFAEDNLYAVGDWGQGSGSGKLSVGFIQCVDIKNGEDKWKVFDDVSRTHYRDICSVTIKKEYEGELG